MNRQGRARARLLAVPPTLGLLVGLPMTAWNWWLNPGQVFRGPDGTNWEPVLATAWSWFWPVALLAAVLLVAFRIARAFRRTP